MQGQTRHHNGSVAQGAKGWVAYGYACQMWRFWPKALMQGQGARCNACMVRSMHIVCPFSIKMTQIGACLQIINFSIDSCRGDHHFALLLALISFDMVHSLSMFSQHLPHSLFGCSKGVAPLRGESPESTPITLCLLSAHRVVECWFFKWNQGLNAVVWEFDPCINGPYPFLSPIQFPRTCTLQPNNSYFFIS